MTKKGNELKEVKTTNVDKLLWWISPKGTWPLVCLHGTPLLRVTFPTQTCWQVSDKVQKIHQEILYACAGVGTWLQCEIWKMRPTTLLHKQKSCRFSTWAEFASRSQSLTMENKKYSSLGRVVKPICIQLSFKEYIQNSWNNLKKNLQWVGDGGGGREYFQNSLVMHSLEIELPPFSE